MQMQIITGGASSGKSAYLHRCILDNINANPDSNAILIVPEQFSFSAEKALSETFGGLGINKIEVLTFSRLIKRFLPQKRHILSSGKMMLLQMAAKSVSEDNIFYLSANRSGFTEALSDLFSELKRYNISPEDFEGLNIENEHTAKKLASINEIYKNYIKNLSETASDSEDDMLRFAETVEKSDIFENTFFYIDDYTDFMPTHYQVITSLLKRSKGVFMTLCIDESMPADLFAPVIKTRNRLFALCEQLSVPCRIAKISGNCASIASPDIRHLIRNWAEKKKYSEKSENISIFHSLDIYSEVEHTAASIISLVRDKGLRFRDIGIICGDMEQYLHIITSVFPDFEIPFFTDEKLSVAMHPVAKTVLSLFDIIKNNWNYSSVFDYLRTGYIYTKSEDDVTAISQEDVDLLENYVLSCGIKGKKAWFSEWTDLGGTPFDEVTDAHSVEEFDLEKLNLLRTEITAPFEHFLENKGRTAAAIAEAVYNFMCDINLYEGLIKECAAFDALGNRNESEQFRQVWNFVIETLDQLVEIAKGGAISREEFADLFLCGLSNCEIAIIPSGLDRVALGTVSRNSPSRVKALFIIGALDGKFPTVSDGRNILSGIDRSVISSALKEHDKELAPDNTGKIMLENFKFYKTLTTATEKLFISFPSVDSEGNAVNHAHFVSEILEMFDINVGENIVSSSPVYELLSSSKRGFHYILSKISEYGKPDPAKLWQSVYDWYCKNPQYREKLDIIAAAASYKKVQPVLSRIKAEMLYGKNKKYSITALEKYEKCPFSYYLERGLKLSEQSAPDICASHIGSLMHLAIYEFCHAVEAGETSLTEIHKRWTSLTDKDCKMLVSGVMDKISEKVLSSAKGDTGRLEYLLSRCRVMLENSVSAIRKSLASGEYAAISYEKDFETVIDWKGDKITLTGKIDRIDIMEQLAGSKLNIRIVDYKSGSKAFSVDAICDKVDMQLVMYAVAAEEMAKSGILSDKRRLMPQISAILYSKIADAESTEISIGQEKSFKDEKQKSQKMDGMFILDEDGNAEKPCLSYESLYDMDSSLTEKNESDFLKIKFDTKGNLYKNTKIASRTQFEIMSKYIKKAAVEADKSIKSGNISITPYCSGSLVPCSYCPYSEICLFDTKNGQYRMPAHYDDAFEYMKGEIE